MSDTTEKRLKVSREGVVLIKSFEGFRASAQPRPDGGWVIGYGHTRSAREGLTVSEADAELLLQYDLIPVVSTLNDKTPAWVNQHQFDALASYAFSIGLDRFEASPVLERLRAGAADEAADAMVGSPEIAPADAVVRRRAAERALFVADIGSPVTLAQLMSAPLPLPVPPMAVVVEPEAVEPTAVETPVVEAVADPVIEPSIEPVEAEQVVETLDAEAEPSSVEAETVVEVVEDVPAAVDVFEPTSEDDVAAVYADSTLAPVADLEPEVVVDSLGPVDVMPDEPATEVVKTTPAVVAAPVETPVEAEAEVETPVEVTDEQVSSEIADVADPAVELEPVAEVSGDTTAEIEPTVEPEASVEETPVEPEAAPEPAPASKPIAASAAASLRLSPYAGVIVGPIPGLTGAMSVVTPSPAATPVNAAAPVEADAPVVVAEPVVEAEPETFDSTPAPVLDAPGLVLTPPDEAETPILRPLWSEADRGITTADESPLFEEVLHPAATAVLRHEAETAPRRTDWSEFGAFAAMGGIGLVSFGAAVAGFRKAAEEGPDGAQLAMVGWVLLLIALICVGVSGYNLFRTWTSDRKAN